MYADFFAHPDLFVRYLTILTTTLHKFSPPPDDLCLETVNDHLTLNSFFFSLSLSSIAEQPEPRERMVQVLKWYLSAFHAGRKGSVAKKPYNPILGEVFYCHWDLPGEIEEPSPPMVSQCTTDILILRPTLFFSLYTFLSL